MKEEKEELKSKDTLGDRMKTYEANALDLNCSKDSYVVIRLDGNHFHTWVKSVGLKKPFDMRMISAIQKATLELCKRIPTCIMGYCQSDEITLVLKKGENEKSEAWFNNRVQKLCSISASICSVAFNDAIQEQFDDEYFERAYFDSRVIFLPSLDEVVNCLIWRQNDCIKNSVATYAQSMFPQKQLLNKCQNEQIEMMLKLKGEDWNKLSTVKKMGTLVHKELRSGVATHWSSKENKFIDEKFTRGMFFVDEEIPRFSTNKQFLIDAYNFKTVAQDEEIPSFSTNMQFLIDANNFKTETKDDKI